MRNRSGVRGRPRAPEPVAKSGFDPLRFAPRKHHTLSIDRRSDMGFTGSSRSQPRSLRNAASLAPSPPLPTQQAGRTAARWGEMPERSCGYGLSSRPPDVHLRACAHQLVFEDPRSDRARMRKASANTTFMTFDAVFPDTFQSVGPAGCPTELPLLGLSKDRPSVVLTTSKSTPGRPLRDCLRNEPARARPRSVLVVFHHLDGLLLRCHARVLQRTPDPGVHSVSAPPPQVTSRRRHLLGMPSLPSEAFPPFEAATSTVAPSREREILTSR
jgi:hypothetical protein